MHPYDDSYATILNISSYSSSIFSKSGLSAEFKIICLMTKRLNPRLARAKPNVDSFIAFGSTSSNHVDAFLGSNINFQMQKQCSRVAPSGILQLWSWLDNPRSRSAPRNHRDSLLHQRLDEADIGEIAIHYYPQCPLSK